MKATVAKKVIDNSEHHYMSNLELAPFWKIISHPYTIVFYSVEQKVTIESGI